MPTPKATDNMPLTGREVSTLQYVEARIHDLGLRLEGQMKSQSELLQTQLEAADLRYAQRFAASQEALVAALNSGTRAVEKSELANEKRFESVNEFRKTLSDQTQSFIPRAEADSKFASLAEKLDTISSRLDRAEGTGKGLSNGWAILVSMIGIVGTISAIVVTFIKLNQ